MILLTGATGQCGRRLLKCFEAGEFGGKIRCLVRDRTKKSDFFESLNLDLEVFEGDLQQEKSLQAALQGIDVLIHTAGIYHSEALVEQARTAGVSWQILVHTTSRFLKYKTEAQIFARIEDQILTRGSDNLTIVRPTMIYGSSEDRNIWKIIRFLSKYPVFPVFGSGKNLMHPIHSEDVAQAIYDIYIHRKKTEGKQYNIAGKNALSYREMLDTISNHMGQRTFFVHIPISLSYQMIRALNVAMGREVVSRELVLRMKEDRKFDFSDAVRDFGFSPREFQEGIQGEVHEFNSRNLS